MKGSEINQWWAKALKKEQFRKSNHPKSPDKNRWMVPTDFSNFAPKEGRKNASKR